MHILKIFRCCAPLLGDSLSFILNKFPPQIIQIKKKEEQHHQGRKRNTWTSTYTYIYIYI